MSTSDSVAMRCGRCRGCPEVIQPVASPPRGIAQILDQLRGRCRARGSRRPRSPRCGRHLAVRRRGSRRSAARTPWRFRHLHLGPVLGRMASTGLAVAISWWIPRPRLPRLGDLEAHDVVAGRLPRRPQAGGVGPGASGPEASRSFTSRRSAFAPWISPAIPHIMRSVVGFRPQWA